MPATLLQQMLEITNLRSAWDAVAQNHGMPGVDHLSIPAWRRDWETRLVQLSREVRSNRYHPGRLRKVQIPKKEPGQWRTLHVPTVSDRVLQRATLQVLMPFYETLFLDCSYGYRPNRGIRQALQRILHYRDAGCAWVLDADIDECFDSLDHELLFDFLRADLADDSLLGLIAAWLQPMLKIHCGAARGVPMGAPISPLLANVYLHRLDAGLVAHGRHVVRYADDFIVLTGRQNRLDDIHQETGELLNRLKLIFEPNKTSLTSFEQGFTFIGVRFLGDQYTYACKDRQVTITGSEESWLLEEYMPEYE